MKKVKRDRVNWVVILHNLDNEKYFAYFGKLLTRWKKFRHSTNMSSNRCAYYTLKHFYSTTTIGELKEKLGL